MRKKRVTEKSEALLWPLLDKESELRAEYRRRNPKFDQRRIKLTSSTLPKRTGGAP